MSDSQLVSVENVRAFRMNDCDTVAAVHLDDAIAWYRTKIALNDEDIIEDPQEVNLQELIYVDESCTEMQTLAEAIKEIWKGEPFIVASTI